MLTYSTTTNDLTPDMLAGFFAGWPNPPSPAIHLQMLEGSAHVVVALDEDRVIGFVNAISDGTLAAFIPLLEVRPENRGQGIGSELLRRMLGLLAPLYSVDVVCDPDVAPFYERLGLQRLTGMAWRNREAAAIEGRG